MSNEEKLLDAVYEKVKIGEPLSIHDLQRWVDFVLRAPLNPAGSNPDEIYAQYNKLITGIQEKFKQQQ
jgi:hypothetical protein